MADSRDHAKGAREHILSKIKGPRVTKIEVARRQLDTAIDLWFHGGDAISIHTLMMSASSILNPIAKEKNAVGGPLDARVVKENKRDQILAIVRFYHNFFKHASSDPDDAVPFDPVVNDSFLMLAVTSYFSITGTRTDKMVAFQARYWVEGLSEGVEDWFPNITAEARAELRNMPRPVFLTWLRKQAVLWRSAGA